MGAGSVQAADVGAGGEKVSTLSEENNKLTVDSPRQPLADNEVLRARVSELEAAITEFLQQSQRFTVSKEKVYLDGVTPYFVHECPACHASKLSHMSSPVKHKDDCPMANLATALGANNE